MGIPITKEVVAGSDIDPSLSGLYIEKDAVPAVQEFLRNAVGEETCFIMCWDHRPAEQAKALAVSLLQQLNRFCTSASVRSPFYSDTFFIVSQSSIEGTLRNIRKFSDGETYSASEVEEAVDSIVNVILDSGYSGYFDDSYDDSHKYVSPNTGLPGTIPKIYEHTPPTPPRSYYSNLAKCFRTDYILTCKNEEAASFTGRLTCKKPTTF